MKTKFVLLLVFCAISLNIFAQEKKIKDLSFASKV